MVPPASLYVVFVEGSSNFMACQLDNCRDQVLTKLELVGCFSAGNATVANQSNASGSLNASTNSSVYIPGTLSNPGPMR